MAPSHTNPSEDLILLQQTCWAQAESIHLGHQKLPSHHHLRYTIRITSHLSPLTHANPTRS